MQTYPKRVKSLKVDRKPIAIYKSTFFEGHIKSNHNESQSNIN